MNNSKSIKKYLNLADVFILVLGSDQKIHLINQKGCEILGYTESQLVGKNWFDYFVPEKLREGVRQVFFRIISGETEQSEFYENPVLTSSGEERTISWRNAVVRDDQGKIVEILSTGEDVTERRLTQEALRNSEATLRAILDTCVDGIITINEQGSILSFNPAAVRIFRYKPEEVIGRDINILMPDPYKGMHPGYLRRYLKTEEPRIIGTGREVVGRRKDGATFPLYLAVSAVSLSGNRMFTGIVRDLTDFKRMQNEIIQAQKLAAIGEMAASVGHEIKNPLAGISGAIEILKDTLEQEDSRRQVMDDILTEVVRLDNTVRDLLAFSRPWNPDTQLCNPQEIVERVSASYREQEGLAHLKFVFDGDCDTTVQIDPWLFEKVLWNLLDNASDAMAGKGEIRFAFEATPGFLTLTVRDNGHGVPTEHQEDVFRPFFTTKNRGTGLGLAICKKIMDAHGGTISLFSIPQKGTRVSVHFPLENVKHV